MVSPLVRRLALVAGLLIVGLASAQALSEQQEALRGLDAVTVGIGGVGTGTGSDSERDGLLLSTLRTDVELRLRQSGVRVDANALPALHVLIHATKLRVRGEAVGYGYTVHVDLREAVALVRGPSGPKSLVTDATIWRSELIIGTVPIAEMSKTIRDDVQKMVDQFLNDYLAANQQPRP